MGLGARPQPGVAAATGTCQGPAAERAVWRAGTWEGVARAGSGRRRVRRRRAGAGMSGPKCLTTVSGPKGPSISERGPTAPCAVRPASAPGCGARAGEGKSGCPSGVHWDRFPTRRFAGNQFLRQRQRRHRRAHTAPPLPAGEPSPRDRAARREGAVSTDVPQPRGTTARVELPRGVLRDDSSPSPPAAKRTTRLRPDLGLRGGSEGGAGPGRPRGRAGRRHPEPHSQRLWVLDTEVPAVPPARGGPGS